jgi:DNA-binding transcriptional regulator YiaG
MDKRFKPIPLPEQIALRRKAVEDVLQHPEWDLAQTVRHLRTSLRLTVPEYSKLTQVSTRTILDVEAGRTAGTVQTLERLVGIVGLKLGVQRAPRTEPNTSRQTEPV